MKALITGENGSGKSRLGLTLAINKAIKENMEILLLKPAIKILKNMELGFNPYQSLEERIFPYFDNENRIIKSIPNSNKIKIKKDFISPYTHSLNSLDNTIIVIEESQGIENKTLDTVELLIGLDNIILIGDIKQQEDTKNIFFKDILENYNDFDFTKINLSEKKR